MEYRANRTSDYRFTIKMSDERDLLGLKSLRETVSAHNKVVKEGRKRDKTGFWARQPLQRVKVYFRRPAKNYPKWDYRSYQPIPESDSGRKYGYGGGCRKDQNPAEADVYVRQSVHGY